MKKIVKVVANYDSDLNIYNSVINSKINDSDNFKLTYGDEYDLLFVINGYFKPVYTDKKNIIGLLQEPINNINYDRNLHFYCSKIYCQSSSMFNSYKNIVKTPVYMFHSGHVTTPLIDIIKEKNTNKSKLCLIMSGLTEPNNPKWINHNYSKRINLLKKILDSDLDIDIFGRGLNLNDKRYKGQIDSKHEILKNYKYSIAIENCCEENYVSEKFFDCILNDSIPLYYGCPNVKQIYGDCFISINIEKDTIINDLKVIVNNEHQDIYNNLLLAKNNYVNNLTVYSLIEKVVNEKNIN